MLEGCVRMEMLPRTSSPFCASFSIDAVPFSFLSVDTDIQINIDGFMRCPFGSILFFFFLFFFRFFLWKHPCCCIALCSISTGFGTCVCNSNTGATPVMAWSSWNFFANSINETIALEIGDALVSTGLSEAGYKYVYRSTRAAPHGPLHACCSIRAAPCGLLHAGCSTRAAPRGGSQIFFMLNVHSILMVL